MSFILEALKKAESERLRGAVPDLHHMPVTALPSHQQRSLFFSPLFWIVITLGLGVLLAIVYFTSTTMMAPASAALSSPTAANVAPAVQTQIPRAPSMPSMASTPLTPVRRAPSPPAPPSTVSNAEVVLPVPTPLPLRNELPANIQQSIPQFVVGGYIYADRAEDRSVILNQKLRHEGELVAPDLVLEKMTRSGMVFNFRGQHFVQSY